MWISREQWQPLVIVAVGTAVWWIAQDVIRSRKVRRVQDQQRQDTERREQEQREATERARAARAEEQRRLQNLQKEKREQLDEQLDTFFNKTHKDWFWKDDLVRLDDDGYPFIDTLIERSEDRVTELVEDSSLTVDAARQSLVAYFQTLETQVQQQTVKAVYDKYVKRYSPEWKWLEGAITDLFGKSEPCSKNVVHPQHPCYGRKWTPPFPEVEPVFNTLLKKWYQHEEGANVKPEQRADFLRGYKVDSSELRFAVPSCKRLEFASWMRSFIAQVREYAKQHSDLATPLASFVLLYGVWSTAMSAIENKTADEDYVFILSTTFVQAVFDERSNRSMVDNIHEALSRADVGFNKSQRVLLEEIMAYPIRQNNVLTYLVGKAWTGQTEIKELKPDALRQALCRNETFQRLVPAFTLDAFPNPLQYRIARAKENVFTWTTRTGNLSTAVRDTEWKWTKQALEIFANDSSDSIDNFLKNQNWGTIIVFGVMKKVLDFFLDVWLNKQAQQWEETKEDNPAIQIALANCKRTAKDGADLIQERLQRLLSLPNGATPQELQQTIYEALYTYQEVQKSSVDLIRAAWVASEVKPAAPSFLGAALIAHCWFTYYRNFFFYGEYRPERSFRNFLVPQGETEFERRLLPYFWCWTNTREHNEYPVGEFRSYYFEYDGKESVRHRDETVKPKRYPRSWLRLFIMNEWKPDYGTSTVLITKASSWIGPQQDLRNWLSDEKSIPEMQLDESVLPVTTLITRLLFAITLNPNF